MKQSLIYLVIFIAGIILAIYGLIPEQLLKGDISKWILFLLLFLVGMQIGSGKNMFAAVRRYGWKITFIPLATTVGTFIGVALISLMLPNRTVTDCLSIGAGFAYYSLSSILITQFKGAELGTIALLANIMREFSVLIFAPWMVKWFGKLAPISAGGATSLDTTLPVIAKFSGNEYITIALFHGLIIDFSVPLWVTFFMNFQ